MPLKLYMCLYPIPITNDGKYKESTYRGKKGEHYHIETYTKCGRCPQCIAEKSNNWVIRNNYEVRAHEKICFITLTYEKCLPFLVKKDFQDFMKRLRRYLEYHNLLDIDHYEIVKKVNKKTGEIKMIEKPIYKNLRAFVCGEYGELHHRPHGHIILYGFTEEKENLKFLEINKKGNIVLQSKIIQEVWGLGRTTYQNFNPYEIPYISLYNTPSEETFKGYIITRDKLKELRKKYKENERLDKKNRKELEKLIKENKFNKSYYILLAKIDKSLQRWKMLLSDIKDTYKELDKEKAKSLSIKEFNTWSKALGWEEFEKEYNKYKDSYDFNEYIEDKTFLTPSPWVKKLANKGDEHAINEMLSRTAELLSRGNTEDLETKNKLKHAYDNVNKKVEWQSKRERLEL